MDYKHDQMFFVWSCLQFTNQVLLTIINMHYLHIGFKTKRSTIKMYIKLSYSPS